VVSASRPATLQVERQAHGVLLLSAGRELASDYLLVIDCLRQAAEQRPQARCLGGRIHHAEAWARTGAIASWLIAQGFGPESAPAATLSGDSLEQALFRLGAQRAGLAVAPFLPDDFPAAGSDRFDEALDLVRPALVVAQDSAGCSAMLDRAAARGVCLVTVDGRRGVAYGALANCSIDAAVAERRLHIGKDMPARLMLVRDSAGVLKAAVNTHGNLAAAAAMMRNVADSAEERDGARWGMAETAGVGFVSGLPLPGLRAKLVPVGARHALRLKGPNVTPGYYRNAEATRAAFDEDGYFETGHTVRWIDAAKPEKGLAFDAESSAVLQSA
jgi:acyl-CoA synthetase (AMP-forming)/AMP-acid ligase II